MVFPSLPSVYRSAFTGLFNSTTVLPRGVQVLIVYSSIRGSVFLLKRDLMIAAPSLSLASNLQLWKLRPVKKMGLITRGSSLCFVIVSRLCYAILPIWHVSKVKSEANVSIQEFRISEMPLSFSPTLPISNE